MTKRAIGLVALAVLVVPLSTLPASAQEPTATPTSTSATPVCTRTPPPAPQSCGSARVTLTWVSKRPDVLAVAISATHCPMPAACAAAASFSSVTTAPVAVEVADSACNAFSSIFTIPALNTTGCPGKDFYKGTTDKLRLIYGASTTALAFVRVPLSAPNAIPTLTPPISYSIRDAAGYAIGGTLNTCLVVHQSESSARLKCF